MKFQARPTTEFTVCPSGNHIAICNAVVDMGLQPGRGLYPDPKHEVYIRFELPTEQIKYMKDGHEVTGPMSIGRTFTASMSEKANLRKFIEGWFGKKFPHDDAAADFDLSLILGKKCLVNVTHTEKNGKTYANIATVAPIPKGMAADYPQHNQSLLYDPKEHDEVMFRSLPEWLQRKVNERLSDDKTSHSAESEYLSSTPSRIDEMDVPF